MTPAIRALGAANMAHARTLPFLIVTDAEGRWIKGASGNLRSTEFLALLEDSVRNRT